MSEENRELHALTNELQTSLDAIMQRHREQVRGQRYRNRETERRAETERQIDGQRHRETETDRDIERQRHRLRKRD